MTLVDTGERKRLELTVEVPVEDKARIGQPEPVLGSASGGPVRTSIWSAIHPRLVELIRAHRSTLLFVNSRRLAERLAGALNEAAGGPLVRAHHGSLAREERLLVEEQLKGGTLQGLVATSSLELGIDMGAIDLVIEIEAPPSVAAGLQRIGRGGHQAGASSVGIIFPNDVLAQQIVAMVAVEDWKVDDLFTVVRRAAPFTALTRGFRRRPRHAFGSLPFG